MLSGAIVWLACSLPMRVQAGGSGVNVVVVANQFSSNSCEVARTMSIPARSLKNSMLGGSTLTPAAVKKARTVS